MIKLNLGCGWRDFGKEWIHIDGGEYPHLHSKDIINLPFEDGTIDEIYASHVFEYFNREEGELILKKWHKKLKIGGLIRLAVPNFETICNLYTSKKYPLSSFVGPLYGKMKMGNEVIYHRTAYDFIELKNILTTSGFKEIKLFDWKMTDHAHIDDHSQAYLPHMDKENGTLISLNVEAVK